MNFMLIRRFFMYFADFRTNFCVFLRLFCFTGLNGYLKKTLSLEQILDNNWVQFCGYESFFVEKYSKNCENPNYCS